MDGEAIGSSKAQYWFVYGCLESKVQALLVPASGDEATPDIILAVLARVYDDPNKAVHAANRLRVIRQGYDEHLRVYIARFESTLLEAGAQYYYPDVSKISLLHNGLNDVLKTGLACENTTPASYADFVKLLDQLSALPPH